MNLYYSIWTDCILRAKSQPQNHNNWKGYTLLFMSMSMAINLITLMAILQRNILHKSFYNIEFSISQSSKLNALISFIILFLLPPIILNYLLIFRNNRYKQIIGKYKYYNGKLFAKYFLGSLILPFVLLLIGYIVEIYL